LTTSKWNTSALFVPLLVLLRVPWLKRIALVLLVLLLLQLLLGVPVTFVLLFCGGRLMVRVSVRLVE
jgi:hypothetical protein